MFLIQMFLRSFPSVISTKSSTFFVFNPLMRPLHNQGSCVSAMCVRTLAMLLANSAEAPLQWYKLILVKRIWMEDIDCNSIACCASSCPSLFLCQHYEVPVPKRVFTDNSSRLRISVPSDSCFRTAHLVVSTPTPQVQLQEIPDEIFWCYSWC